MIASAGHPDTYFAGSDDRVPAVMTSAEACRYLRLDAKADGSERDIGAALSSLDYLLAKRGLPSLRIGQARRFYRPAVDAWMMAQTEAEGGSDA
ncbi:MAG: hypothetical protein SW019_25605 [Actinomycetota bacterium]|nr:hypothetical protein [Actinomycetota bacterium]